MIQDIEKHPVGWYIDILYILLHATQVIVSDIDLILLQHGDGFKKEKKQALGRYYDCQKKADQLAAGGFRP